MGAAAGLAAGALALVAAYQTRPSYELQLGGPLDGPFVSGFNTREVTTGPDATPFRWSRGRSELVIPSQGAQDFNITLSLNGLRPPGEDEPRVRVTAGGSTLLDVTPRPAREEYTFRAPREVFQNSGLTLGIDVNAFTPRGDPNPRPLGVVVYGVRFAPGNAPDLVIVPPLDVVAAVSLAGLAAAVGAAVFGPGIGLVAVSAAVPGLTAALLVVFDRLWITGGSWPLQWPQATLVGLAVAGASWLVLAGLRRAGLLAVDQLYTRTLLLLVLWAAAIRMAAMLHPQIMIVDLNFHRNRLETVMGGTLLFTIPSNEWAGRQTFYLPTAYLVMAPLQWLIENTTLVVRMFMAFVGTLGASVVFALGSRVHSGRAGLTAAFLYLALPMAVLVFSWGIATNLLGELAALGALAAIVLTPAPMIPARAGFWVLSLCLLLALLSHPGVVQLVALAVLVTAGLMFRGRGELRKRGAWAGAALGLAGAASFALYYIHFATDMIRTLGEIRSDRSAGEGVGIRVGGPVADRGLGLVSRYATSWGDWLWGGLHGLWQETYAYFRVWPLGAALILWGGSRGSATSPAGRRLRTAAIGWLAAALVFALIGWALNLYVRYMLFLLPFAALGAGVLVARIAVRGSAGRWLGWCVTLFFAVEAGTLLYSRISYAFK